MNYIYPIQEIRSLFPALCRLHNGNKAVYLDGPGGSQVVATAITAMTNYMRRGVANTHGKFPSSEETEALIESAKAALGGSAGLCAQRNRLRSQRHLKHVRRIPGAVP